MAGAERSSALIQGSTGSGLGAVLERGFGTSQQLEENRELRRTDSAMGREGRRERAVQLQLYIGPQDAGRCEGETR